MNLTFGKTSPLLYSVFGIILISLLYVVFYNNQNVRRTSDSVEHTQEVLRMSDAILLDILTIEAGTRGYILTGNEQFLASFGNAITATEGNFATLKTFTKDNPSQQIRLDSMIETGKIRGSEIEKTIEKKRENKLSETEKRLFIIRGLVLMAKIKERVADFQAEEFRLLKERKAANDRSSQNSDFLFLGLLFAIAAISIFITFIILNHKKRNKTLEDYAISQKKIENELIEAKLLAEEAQIKAENAMKSKQQFLSNMSHEIRTPLNGIIGFTKVALKTDLSAKQKEYLTAIKISGDALIVLINDILDLAKVDAGKMNFEQKPFKLEDSILTMSHFFDAKIQEKNLMIIKEYDNKIPSILIGDRIRLNQIILNLLGNAVKFTAEGNITIKVTLLAETKENVSIEFAIIDTGIGIAEDKLDTIFENFQQASSSFGGTGLGLAISKQLVEAQGGNIEVKSKLNEGSTFAFVLNFLKTDITEIGNEIENEMGLGIDDNAQNIKVLVVEDMPLNQLLVRTILDEFGFERDIASNGKIAIEKLKTQSYDIILMDLQMPEMNGFEATEYIRKTLHSNIPIIALTADVTTVDVEKCKIVGMDDYISKPIDEKVLYHKIMNLVKKPAALYENKIPL
jgi:signal transduction histidine kinase/ActR/RegA family two-component response regulator